MNSQINTSALDAAVVLVALLMVGGIVSGLMFVHDIPTSSLPIVAALATAVLGLPIAYGAFRWGSSVTAKKMAGAQEQGE